MKDLSYEEFVAKLTGVTIPILVAFLWVAMRSIKKRAYVMSGVTHEREAILRKEKEVAEFQTTVWAVNASQVQGFTAISVAIVLLVVVFLVEKSMNTWSQLFMNLIVAISGISSLSYAFSLQFWNCALDRTPQVEWVLKQRKRATALQAIGWFCLYISVLLAVAFADMWIGTILSILGASGLVIVMENKLPR